MEASTELIQKLMELAYVATGNGLHREASTIFGAVASLRPESEMPLIGLAVTQMNAGRAPDAVRTLGEKALTIAPASQLALCFLGLALKLSGLRAESQSVLQDVVTANTEPHAVEMARNLLAEM